MADESAFANLGFAKAKLPHGTHICQIYGDDDERNMALLAFLAAGLEAKESCSCFSRGLSSEMIEDYLCRHDLSYDESIRRGSLSTYEADEVYFKNNSFDPELMLDSLADLYCQSVESGHSGCRVIGEMLPDILSRPGGDRLMEYEARVSILLRNHPITTVCQYDARAFSGATIMDILNVHPMMVVRGNVIENPFYVSPEEFLGK